MKYILLLIAIITWIQVDGQPPRGSHIISGEFDTSKPVRVVAVAAVDTMECLELHRGTYTNSYTMKLPAYSGIVIFFHTGTRGKRIYIPHTIDEKPHFHWIDVQFSRSSHYLIYQADKSREMDRIVIE